MRHAAKKFVVSHHRKIAFTAPIAFLFVLNAGGVDIQGNILYLRAEKSAFVTAGETVRVNLEFYSKTGINAAGGAVSFPPELLRVDSLSREVSAIDLWSEEPSYDNSTGKVRFSGGITLPENTPSREGVIFVLNMRTLGPGKAEIKLSNGELLAADGLGTNVFSGSNILNLYIYNSGAPSPDINGDGILSVADANHLYLSTFRAYDRRYDLNVDGKVSWADVKHLIALF